LDVFLILFCHGVEKNRFTTHSNGLEGLQKSHGWWPSPPSMVFYKICHSSGLLLPPYWNALLTQRILDIFCCVKWRKSFWYPFQWARWVSTVPWVMTYQPSMGCHKISRPEMTYWTEENVVATKLHVYAHAEESTLFSSTLDNFSL